MNTSRRQFLSGVGSSVLGVSGVSTLLKATRPYDNSYSKQVQIVGHRGFSSEYKDNSIAGFRAADKAGADGVELDIRRTKDERLILKHDWFELNITDGEVEVSELTYNELKQENTELLTAERAFEFLSTTDLDLYIGLKEPTTAELLPLLAEYNLLDRTMFLSFDMNILNSVPDIYPTALVGILPSEFMLEQAAMNSISCVLPHYTSLSSLRDFFRSAETYDLKYGYWAISSNHYDISVGVKTKPDILITNDPRFAVEQLRNS